MDDDFKLRSFFYEKTPYKALKQISLKRPAALCIHGFLP